MYKEIIDPPDSSLETKKKKKKKKKKLQSFGENYLSLNKELIVNLRV